MMTVLSWALAGFAALVFAAMAAAEAHRAPDQP